jgi:hypothetical protein
MKTINDISTKAPESIKKKEANKDLMRQYSQQF